MNIEDSPDSLNEEKCPASIAHDHLVFKVTDSHVRKKVTATVRYNSYYAEAGKDFYDFAFFQTKKEEEKAKLHICMNFFMNIMMPTENW